MDIQDTSSQSTPLIEVRIIDKEEQSYTSIIRKRFFVVFCLLCMIISASLIIPTRNRQYDYDAVMKYNDNLVQTNCTIISWTADGGVWVDIIIPDTIQIPIYFKEDQIPSMSTKYDKIDCWYHKEKTNNHVYLILPGAQEYYAWIQLGIVLTVFLVLCGISAFFAILY